MTYKIGIGYDIHRLVRGRKLFIGGIEIPYKKGLLGHSDADVLIHAVCDALLGALGDADIGMHFPDMDPKYRDISSIVLLNKVMGLVSRKGFRINNIDTVIILEQPKLFTYKKAMQEKIAKILRVKSDCVGIKAKTNELLGEIGNKKAIAAYAIAMLVKGVRK